MNIPISLDIVQGGMGSCWFEPIWIFNAHFPNQKQKNAERKKSYKKCYNKAFVDSPFRIFSHIFANVSCNSKSSITGEGMSRFVHTNDSFSLMVEKKTLHSNTGMFVTPNIIKTMLPTAIIAIRCVAQQQPASQHWESAVEHCIQRFRLMCDICIPFSRGMNA